MNLPSIIESILFASGEPMTAGTLARYAGVSPDEAASALINLQKALLGRGILLIENNGAFQLGTHPDNAQFLEQLARSEFGQELSRAALETLAIIAYKGPLSRADIEHIRGVNSSFILRNVLLRGLVERVENPRDLRSYSYRITHDFLALLGIAAITDLPDYTAFRARTIEIAEEKRSEEVI